MARPAHPLRARAVYLMRRGLATPFEIAMAGDLEPSLVRTWRRRAGKIDTKAAREKRVRFLLQPGKHGP